MEPAGIVMPFAGSTAPQGYLLCDGSAVDRTVYATLFAVIGTTYGAGDGSTTFNVPDISGRVVIGPSQSHVLGSTGGSETVTLTESELPAHAHEVPKHGHANNLVATTPKFVHSITQPVFKYNKPGSGVVDVNTASTSNSFVSSTTTATATRSTNVAVAQHNATACTKSGSITNKEAFTTNTSGADTGHNNMQPYVTMRYIICTGD